MEHKLNVLKRYSDIYEVRGKAREIGISNEIHPSSRKDKKYMVFDGNKMVHFGQIGFEDATKHHDERRIRNFKSRNRRWETASRYSPAWLSYKLLW